MSIPERCRKIAEAHKTEAFGILTNLEMQLGGKPFTDLQKQDLWEKGLWRLAVIRAGETPPVPDGITAELIVVTPSSDLLQLLWDYLCTFLAETGCYKLNGPEREVVRALPRALRMVYTVSLLDSEVRNGGFSQFFSNQRSILDQDTVEALRLIGADKLASIAEKACGANDVFMRKYMTPPNEALFRKLRALETAGEKLNAEHSQIMAAAIKEGAELERQLDRLTSEWYGCDDAFLSELMEKYVRNHPDECLHSRA